MLEEDDALLKDPWQWRLSVTRMFFPRRIITSVVIEAGRRCGHAGQGRLRRVTVSM